MRPRTAAFTLATAALACLSLTACDSLGPGGDGTPSDPTSPAITAATERPTAVPTDLRECPTDKDRGGPPVGALAGWDVQAPDGFVEVSPSRYGQFAPIEGDVETRFFDLQPDGFPDVLGLAYYPQLEQGPVTDVCGRLDHEAVLERIDQQLAESDEEVLGGPVVVDLAGQTAYEVLAQQEAGYMIRNYFVYGHHELLHIECQWVEHEDAIADGCDALLASVTW